MFGYVVINRDELKVKEAARYRGFYCGLCRSLASRCGVRGQMILPYDMAFLDILLNGLYEEKLEEKDITCLAHPLTKQHVISNSITDYCADIGMLLAYYKMLDDVQDAKDLKAKAVVGLLKSNAGKAAQRWPEKAEAIAEYIRLQNDAERSGKKSIDEIAGLSGTVLGKLFVYKDDLWADILNRMGFYLGKYIYLLDAYDDLEKDRKCSNFNPWAGMAERSDFDAYVENTLMMMMAECAREFEKLPIVQDGEILRNVIYSGVWTGYRNIKLRRERANGEKS